MTDQPPRSVTIEVENLVTHYGDRLILKGVSLTVYDGEILVIMGGSGSGKSTLLNHLLGCCARPRGGSGCSAWTSTTAHPSNSRNCARRWAWPFKAARCSVR